MLSVKLPATGGEEGKALSPENSLLRPERQTSGGYGGAADESGCGGMADKQPRVATASEVAAVGEGRRSSGGCEES
jgi:hypothetical protein